MSTLDCVLWDFSGTLTDESIWSRPPDALPGWSHAWERLLASQLLARWDCGEGDRSEVEAWLAVQLDCPTELIRNELTRICKSLAFIETTIAAVRRRRVRQALVTVHCDLFTSIVVPHFDLDPLFDEIVVSCREGTRVKANLCDIAIERLGVPCRSRALLIDNLESNITEWRSRGGAGYLFTDEDDFHRDLARYPLSTMAPTAETDDP